MESRAATPASRHSHSANQHPTPEPSTRSVQPIRRAHPQERRPIEEPAVQLEHNKGTFIIQLGTCQGSQKKKTSNLVLQGEDAQKSGLRVTGTNKRRTKLITRVHCTETKGEGELQSWGQLPCNLKEHENKCGKVVPDEHL